MSTTDGANELLYEERDEIGWVTFNRPEVRNALTFAMYDGLANICKECDRSVGAIVLTGAGTRSFAAGTDISQFLNLRTESDALEYERHVEAVIATVEECAVPTIAAIRGSCTGGGAAIAAACDLRLGSPSASFGIPIARTLGNCLAPNNLARFAAIIGAARLKEIVFTARLVGAQESRDIGWLHEVVESEESLLLRAGELARAVADNAPLTLRATKIALRRLRGEADVGHDLVKMCYLSGDFREGVEAFLEKRPPNWKGI